MNATTTAERPREAVPVNDDIRATGFGASEGAAILEVSPWKTPIDVYLDKVAGRVSDETDLTIFGQCVEPGIARFYERTHDLALRYPLPITRHARYPFILATPDAERSPTHGVELKSMDWRIAKLIDERSLDEVKPDYVVQCQQQMLVMGWDVVTLVALIDRKLRTWEVPRNEALISLIVEVGSEFWDRVERRDPPPVNTSHPRAIETIKRLHGQIHEGAIIQLSAEAGRAFEEYERLGAMVREAEEQRKALRAQYLLEIGDAYAGVLPGGDRMIRRAVVAEKLVEAYVRKSYIDARAVKYRGEPIISLAAEDAVGLVDDDDIAATESPVEAAHRRLVAAGFRCNHRSPSGSVYYVHTTESIRVRISDHEPNAATARWIERNDVYDVRAGVQTGGLAMLDHVDGIIREVVDGEILNDAD